MGSENAVVISGHDAIGKYPKSFPQPQNAVGMSDTKEGSAFGTTVYVL